MIEIVMVDGGLGNNLFQLHYAWRLRYENPTREILLCALDKDGSEGGQFIRRVAARLDLRFASHNKEPNTATMIIGRLKRTLSEKRLFQPWRESFVVTSFSNYRLHCGYWQSLPLSTNTRTTFDDAVAELLGSKTEMRAIIHIRGGDYLSRKNSRIYKSLGSEYYRRAFLEVDKVMPGSTIQVVSNDRFLAEQIFAETDREPDFLPIGGLMSDFSRLSQNRFVICSNSTFCWWAARIGLYKGHTERIVAPAFWVNKGFHHRSHPSYLYASDSVLLVA